MLLSLENLLGYRIKASDGDIGKVHDFFFDDRYWKLRYLVVETGNWLNRRRVLLAPASLGRIDGQSREFEVSLTRSQVQSSPDVDTAKPVSRQQEISMNEHYGWPAYWTAEALLVHDPIPVPPPDFDRTGDDPHLRSFREISTYNVNHREELIAKVRDFVIDDRDWSMTLMVSSLGGKLHSRVVGIHPGSISEVSWSKGSLAVCLSREEMNKLPVFDPSTPVNRVERTIHVDYFGKIVNQTGRQEYHLEPSSNRVGGRTDRLEHY